MKPISPFGLPIGISIAIWSVVGCLRLVHEMFRARFGKKRKYNRYTASDIVVLLPAHNEEVVIRSAIQSLKKVVEPHQIYVISDGSQDKTYRRARMEGVHVSELLPGRGKAKGLVYLLKQYNLFKRYKLIFIVDADTRIDENALKYALPLFNDRETGVVFASSQIRWKQHIIPKLSYYFFAYRDRLNRILQYCFVYGQTWKYTNVNYVIPGFATIYRSEILKQLEIDTPGLLIEDFNLAFQFHKKKLGKIGYAPLAIGWDQYPDNLIDYWNQVRRWNIGFFQTVKKNGVWPSFFWAALGLFSLEIILNSIFMLFLPFILIFDAAYILAYFNITHAPILSLSSIPPLIPFYEEATLENIFIGVFVIDYFFSVIIGLVNKKPQFIFYGLFFFFMHSITSLILLSSIYPGFFGTSDGRWKSPKRF